MAAQNPFPVQLQTAPQIPTPDKVPPIRTWKDIPDAFMGVNRYLLKLVQFLSQLLGKYAININLTFNAAQTVVGKSVSLPNSATTLIGNVAFNQLVALAQGDMISMVVQGVMTASKTVTVIVKGSPSGAQISGLPNATQTSDGNGNFHFYDLGTVPSAMIGDTSLNYYISQSTGGAIGLTSANLGCVVSHSL